MLTRLLLPQSARASNSRLCARLRPGLQLGRSLCLVATRAPRHGHSHLSPPSSSDDSSNTPGNRALRRVTVLGAGVNIALALGKGAAGVLGNSAAMIADAAHSLSDLLSDLVTLVVLQEAHKPADEDHPWGHGKFESMGSLSLAAILVGTGAAIGMHSLHIIQDLIVQASAAAATAELVAAPTSLALGAAIASVIVKEALYHVTGLAQIHVNS
jgi:divalent metal cation (Fe/Co/Zn/Cd) transporter